MLDFYELISHFQLIYNLTSYKAYQYIFAASVATFFNSFTLFFWLTFGLISKSSYKINWFRSKSQKLYL